MGEVVGPVRLDHPLDLFLILRDLSELRPQRRAEAFDPHVVGRHRLVAAMELHRVAVGPKNQLDGIDDRAIEVEEERRERHLVKLTC